MTEQRVHFGKIIGGLYGTELTNPSHLLTKLDDEMERIEI